MRRETFETLAVWEVAFFYLLIPIVIAVFVFGVVRLISKYRRGRGTTSLDHMRMRVSRVAVEAAFQRRIGRGGRAVRLSHMGILYGFVALVAATGILMLNDDFTRVPQLYAPERMRTAPAEHEMVCQMGLRRPCT